MRAVPATLVPEEPGIPDAEVMKAKRREVAKAITEVRKARASFAHENPEIDADPEHFIVDVKSIESDLDRMSDVLVLQLWEHYLGNSGPQFVY